MYRALTLTLFIVSAMLTTSCGLKKTASEFLPRKSYVYVQKTVKLRKCLDDKVYGRRLYMLLVLVLLLK